ncbi:MAG: FtsB family cell division protein [Pseudonocardiaceae bacterium]
MGDAGPIGGNGTPARSVPTHPLAVRLGSAMGITSPRRAALLAVVVCVLVLSVAVPLRNYVGQRAELATVYGQQHILADKIAELERRRDLLADPQQVETQARERLRYVHPGEIPYLVQLPPGMAAADAGRVQAPKQPWYSGLWKSINRG